MEEGRVMGRQRSALCTVCLNYFVMCLNAKGVWQQSSPGNVFVFLFTRCARSLLV